MSRSYRKNKIFSTTSSGSKAGAQKKFKIQEHQAERSNTRIKLKTCEDYDNLVFTPKEYGNEWASPRDGKHYWKNATEKDMRK